MNDQRNDDETLGRALGRAVASQSVPETPFSQSRLTRGLERPARSGWLSTLAAAAAIALFVAMGAFFFSRGQPVVTSPNASETPAATSSPSGPPPTPTATPTLMLARIYFARDQLPPVGVEQVLQIEPGIQAGNIPSDQRVGRLLAALGSKSVPVPTGAIDAFPRSDPAGYHGQRVTVAGDLATIDFEIRTPDGDWGVRGAAQTQALLQQIVYTATEVSGVRRVRLTQNGTPLAIDQLVIDKPLSREDVYGYHVTGSDITAGDGDIAAEVVDWRASVDDVAPGLGRFVVELRPAGQAPQGFFVPGFTAKLEQGRNSNDGEPGKFVLRLELPDALWPQTQGEAFHCCPLKVIGKTPIRQLSAYPLTSSGGRPGVGFAIDLDDARPWRVTVMQSPLRVVVDIGGAPDAVSESVAVYSPRAAAEVGRSFTVSGVARAFEANVNWRVHDSIGRVVATGNTTASIGTSAVWGGFQTTVSVPTSVSGNVTLEVFWASPRDGSDVGLVRIPLTLR